MDWSHNKRIISVASFSLLFAYLLSFVFEGRVLYEILNARGISSHEFIFVAILSHFIGLVSCGFVIHPFLGAKKTMLAGMAGCFFGTLAFFSNLPMPALECALALCAYSSGCAVAAWGYYLKTCTPRNEKLKTCADVLIYSNIIMTFISFVTILTFPLAGLFLSLLTLLFAAAFTYLLPDEEPAPEKEIRTSGEDEPDRSLRTPMVFLIVFVVLLTINSGLMYQVLNPAFEHLSSIACWYWALPYIVVLWIMRNLPRSINRSYFLYVGMAMVMMSFIAFMLLKRGPVDYLIVDTLMLGACGIFDLFWWSIIGEMLDFSEKPVRTAGICISANVLGVFLGGLLGNLITSVRLPDSHTTVIALSVVCVTLAIMPTLNRRLLHLLKTHSYLLVYSELPATSKAKIVSVAKAVNPLTDRECEVLDLILSAKSNKAIAEKLFISESTVKTHVKNIFAKYDVASRAELISSLLKNQPGTN